MPKPASLSDPRLLRLLQMLGNLDARVLDVDVPDPRFAVGYCWYNTYAQQQAAGGKVVHGWLFWDDNRGVLAQHHSVWEKPDGQLLDVTPNDWDAARTTFAASPQHPFDYVNLKGWLSVRCLSSTAMTLEGVNELGVVIWDTYAKPAVTSMKVTDAELDKIRLLCPDAGRAPQPPTDTTAHKPTKRPDSDRFSIRNLRLLMRNLLVRLFSR